MNNVFDENGTMSATVLLDVWLNVFTDCCRDGRSSCEKWIRTSSPDTTSRTSTSRICWTEPPTSRSDSVMRSCVSVMNSCVSVMSSSVSVGGWFRDQIVYFRDEFVISFRRWLISCEQTVYFRNQFVYFRRWLISCTWVGSRISSRWWRRQLSSLVRWENVKTKWLTSRAESSSTCYRYDSTQRV